MALYPTTHCPQFPWVLLLTRSELTSLLVLRSSLELEAQIMAPGLEKLSLTNIGTGFDRRQDIVQRSDTARMLLDSLARKHGFEFRGHLDLRDGAFELVLSVHRSGEDGPKSRIRSNSTRTPEQKVTYLNSCSTSRQLRCP